MAKAPSAAKAKRARGGSDETVIELTWRGRRLSFATGDLGPGDDHACRLATGGYPFSGYVQLLSTPEKVGTDIIAVILWMARRKNGEPGLTWQAHLDDIGSNDRLLGDLDFGGELPASEDAPGPLDVTEV